MLPDRRRRLRAFRDARCQLRIDFGTAKVHLRQRSAKPILVPIKDLSTSGFRAGWPHQLSTGEKIWLRIPGLEALAATVVWYVDFEVGAKFDQFLHPLVFAHVTRKLTARQLSG